MTTKEQLLDWLVESLKEWPNDPARMDTPFGDIEFLACKGSKSIRELANAFYAGNESVTHQVEQYVLSSAAKLAREMREGHC